MKAVTGDLRAFLGPGNMGREGLLSEKGQTSDCSLNFSQDDMFQTLPALESSFNTVA